MRPTHKMFRRRESLHPAAKPADLAAKPAARTPDRTVVTRRQQIDKAAAIVGEAHQKQSIKRVLGAVLDALKNTATVTPGKPGSITVRVVGHEAQAQPPRTGPAPASKKGQVMVPLFGLQVQLTITLDSGKPAVIHGTTDIAGLVHLTLPGDRGGPYELVVLSPADGRPIATVKGELTINEAETQLVQLAHRPELEPSFAGGRAWLTGIERAEERAKRLEGAFANFFQEQLTELELARKTIEITPRPRRPRNEGSK